MNKLQAVGLKSGAAALRHTVWATAMVVAGALATQTPLVLLVLTAWHLPTLLNCQALYQSLALHRAIASQEMQHCSDAAM